MTVTIKTPQEIEKMRVAGKLASEVLDYITPFVKPGVSTGELDTPLPQLYGGCAENNPCAA